MNRLTSFSEFPQSQALENVSLANNRIAQISNFSNSPNIKNLDLKSNKMAKLPIEIFNLQGRVIRDHDLGREF